jgi:hypothetical protein
MVTSTHIDRGSAMLKTPSPFSPAVIRVMFCLLVGCAIVSLFHGPGPLIAGIIGLVVSSLLIQRRSRRR